MKEKLVINIQNALLPDTTIRVSAEKNLNDIQVSNYGGFITGLVSILVDESMRSDVRFTSGVILRNSLYSKNISILNNMKDSWQTHLSKETRFSIRKALISNMDSPNLRASVISSTVLSCIARHEFECGDWDDFCSFFSFEIMRKDSSLNYLKNVLTCVCTLSSYLNGEFYPQEVLNIILSRLRSSENPDLIVHALKGLCDIQDFIKEILCKNYGTFIQTLIQLYNINEEITSLIIKNINKFISFGISYVTDLNSLKTSIAPFIRNEHENIILEAIDFFTVLAEKEKEDSIVYVTDFLSTILPSLFLYMKKDENYDEDEWNCHKASISCIQVLGTLYNFFSDVNIRNYIVSKLEDKDIAEKEAGIMVLGSCIYFAHHGKDTIRYQHVVRSKEYIEFERSRILNNTDENFRGCRFDVVSKNKYINDIPFHGPEKQRDIYVLDDSIATMISGCIRKILSFIVISPDLTIPASSPFRDTCLWCLARILENNYQCLDLCDDIVILSEKVQIIVKEQCKESLNATWVLNNLLKSASDFEEGYGHMNHLTLYYIGIINTLVIASDLVDFSNFHLRNALFSAISAGISISSYESRFVLDRLYTFYVAKIKECLEYVDKVDDNQFIVLEDLISNYLIVIQNVYIRKGEWAMGDGKREVFQIIIKVLQIKRNTTLFSDIYTILSKLISDKSYFAINIDMFVPFVIRDLESNDLSLLKSSVNFIGDIANFMSVGFLSLSQNLIPSIIKLLQRSDVSREIKPIAIQVLGDIALSLGRSFEPYLEMCFMFLSQIIGIERKIDEEFIDQLRGSVLSLLNCILIGVEDSKGIKDNIKIISEFMKKVLSDDKKGRNLGECLALIKEINTVFGKVEGCEWMETVVRSYVDDAKYGQLAKEMLKN